jgi:hypothetical protein
VRGEMDEGPKLEKAEDDLSRACNTDLKLFTKCFFDFYHKYKSKDEIADIVGKITVLVTNLPFSDGHFSIIFFLILVR